MRNTDIVIKILEYLIDVDRGLNNYDTEYLRELLAEAREKLEDEGLL